jgi:hypothetical protein
VLCFSTNCNDTVHTVFSACYLGIFRIPRPGQSKLNQFILEHFPVWKRPALVLLIHTTALLSVILVHTTLTVVCISLAIQSSWRLRNEDDWRLRNRDEHEQIELRSYAIIFFLNRLYANMPGYFGLYAIILLQKFKRLYEIISLSHKRRLFHLFHYEYFTYFFGTYYCDYCDYTRVYAFF